MGRLQLFHRAALIQESNVKRQAYITLPESIHGSIHSEKRQRQIELFQSDKSRAVVDGIGQQDNIRLEGTAPQNCSDWNWIGSYFQIRLRRSAGEEDAIPLPAQAVQKITVVEQ